MTDWGLPDLGGGVYSTSRITLALVARVRDPISPEKKEVVLPFLSIKGMGRVGGGSLPVWERGTLWVEEGSVEGTCDSPSAPTTDLEPGFGSDGSCRGVPSTPVVDPPTVWDTGVSDG